MRTVYLESSVFGYLTARPSKDLVAAARQEITARWWHERRQHFEIFISAVVETESGRGDPAAAARRLSAMIRIPKLKVTPEVERLADQLLQEGVVPEVAVDDALHVALGAVHRMDYLLTWNCRHIDNAEKKPLIRSVCAIHGYVCPEICTPEELMGESSDEG